MNKAMAWGNILHAAVERRTRVENTFASTSKKIVGALWRCRDGVTHVIGGWSLKSYDQTTRCGLSVRYRRGEWLYEILGLAPTYPNCLSCASNGGTRYNFTGVRTGRMSFKNDNLHK